MKRHFLLIVLLSSFAMACCDQKDPVPEPTAVKLEYPPYFGQPAIPENNALTSAGVALGRHLFYETRLSADNKVSCASCHQQNKAFTDGRQFSKGIKGQTGTFNSMSLVNLAWSSKFFWNGRTNSLEEQALEPIQHPKEMGLSLEEAETKLQNTSDYPLMFEEAFGSSDITAENIAKALAQFQRSIVSADTRYDTYITTGDGFTEEEEHGFELFFTHPEPAIQLRGGNCGDCHNSSQLAGAAGAFDGFHNNGLDSDEQLADGLAEITGNSEDRGKFKAPSLRNIALTAPYMHDGRFQTLEEVLDHYNEHIQRSETLDVLILEASNDENPPEGQVRLSLTATEKKAIITFLQTLTDSTLITNPAYSDPFE